MKTLILLLILSACGTKNAIDISDSTQTILVKFDMESLFASVVDDCNTMYGNTIDRQSCYERQMQLIDDLINAVNGSGTGSGSIHNILK